MKHSIKEYGNGHAHTNGVESSWSIAETGYVNEAAGRHNLQERDTLIQMQAVVMGIVGRRLMYRDLVAE